MTRNRWGILAFLMLIAFMGHFNRISISVAGTEKLRDEYQFSDPQLGVVYSSFVFMYTFLMTPGGWLIDRIGAVKSLALMGCSLAVLEAATGLVSVFPGTGAVFLALIVIRGVAGAASAPLHPGASRVVSRWMPPADQPLANGMVTAAAVAGIASTFYLFGWLMDACGWPAAFVAAGGITLVVMGGWWLFATERPISNARDAADAAATDAGGPRPSLRDAPSPTSFSPRPAHAGAESIAAAPPDSSALWELLRNRNLICLTLSYSAVGYFQYIFFYWTEHIFLHVLSVSKQTSRTYSTLALLSMAVGMLLGGWLANRLAGWSLRVPALALIPICGMLVSAVSVVLSGMTLDPEWVLCWFSLAMAGIGACEGPMWTLAVRMGRRSGGTAAGIFNTGGNVGGIVSPTLTPLLGRYFGWEKGLWIASMLCVLGAVLWIGIDTREEADSAS